MLGSGNPKGTHECHLAGTSRDGGHNIVSDIYLGMLPTLVGSRGNKSTIAAKGAVLRAW